SSRKLGKKLRERGLRDEKTRGIQYWYGISLVSSTSTESTGNPALLLSEDAQGRISRKSGAFSAGAADSDLLDRHRSRVLAVVGTYGRDGASLDNVRRPIVDGGAWTEEVFDAVFQQLVDTGEVEQIGPKWRRRLVLKAVGVAS